MLVKQGKSKLVQTTMMGIIFWSKAPAERNMSFRLLRNAKKREKQENPAYVQPPTDILGSQDYWKLFKL